MFVSKTTPESVYALTGLSFSEITLITMTLVEFQKAFGVKNGYQDFAKQLYTKITNTFPEVKANVTMP